MAVDITKVDAIIDKHGRAQQGLIPSLLEIQKEFYYLPAEALRRVSTLLEIPLIRVYQVASFYKAFSLEPRGKHIITVCMGTACHVRGSVRLIEQIGRLLNIKPGQTSKDQQFTLEAVNCVGACALGPVMVIDNTYFGHMSGSKVESVLKKYSVVEVREAASNG